MLFNTHEINEAKNLLSKNTSTTQRQQGKEEKCKIKPERFNAN